jgi:adhesin transport system outer membrane protein
MKSSMSVTFMHATKDRSLSVKIALTGLLLSSGFLSPAKALDLSAMVADSISAHPAVKEKVHAYRKVVSDQAIAESGWRPSIDLQASTGYFNTETPATNNESVDYNSSQVELSVTQNLFNGYDTTNQVAQSKARATAALYDVYDTADNIGLQAVQAYLEVLKQRRLYQLAIKNVAAHEKILAQIRERNLSGVGRRSQLQQTEGRLAGAQASLIAQQNNFADAATHLHQVLGRYVDPEFLSEPDLPVLPHDTLDALIDQALIDHPAMRVADSNIVAAQSDYRRSLRTRYPNIDLRLATEYGNNLDSDDGQDGDSESTSLMLNLTYNFYSGGRNNAESQRKVSEVYEQKEFAAGVRRQVINALRLSWTADDLLVRQLVFLNNHVIKAGQTVESYREEFFIGQRDLLDLLDAENELNRARNLYAESRFDSFGARYRIYEGIGRLFEATHVEFELDAGQLRVARLATNEVDKLPLPVDEDADRKLDPMDHCDNSPGSVVVNPFGCQQSLVISRAEAALPKQNNVPILIDDNFEVETNDVLIITTAQLLANDADADSDPLEIVDVSQPEVGRLAFDQNGNLVYRPREGFSGRDSFKYTVTDNKSAAVTITATAQITVRKSETISLSQLQLVNFVFDEAVLTEISKSKVDAIIERIKLADDITIEVYTYTDNIGSDTYNNVLSMKRAEALKDLLVENGIDKSDIQAIGMGEKEPIADNSTPAGQAINRRGEFIFKAKTYAE